MAVPQYCDEVLITLSSVDAPTKFAFPNRRIFLSKEKPSIEIGRTSKRNVSFEAAKNNAWFDSAVMSRKHALFTLDAENQRVFVKDTGSLHGTYKNNIPLEKNIQFQVLSGEKLKFGAAIDRGVERYPPCSLEVQTMFGTMSPDDRPKVFRVPDESDAEATSSDDDQVRNSYEILRSRKINPRPLPSSSPSRSPIDLTCDDQYPLSNVRDDISPVSHPSISKAVQIPDVSAPEFAGYGLFSSRVDSEASKEDTSISPDSNDWGFSEVEEEEEINMPQSTDMDTESSSGDVSEAEDVYYGPSPAADSYDDPDTFDDPVSVDADEHDFDEHDEFEDEQGMILEHIDCPSNVDFLDDLAPSNDLVNPVNVLFAQEAPMDKTSTINESSGGQFSTAPVATYAEPQVDSFNTPGSKLPQQPDGNNAQSDKINYLLSPDLPRMAPVHLVTSVKLPSLSEAMSFDPYESGQNSAMAAAEILGRKTGKQDYFFARLENKANASIACPQPRPHSLERNQVRLSDHQHVPDLTVHDSEAATDDVAAVISATERAEAPQAQVVQVAGSDLASRGIKFINSPPQELAEVTNAEPVLDESSAWQFELSKKASSTADINAKEVSETIDASVDATVEAGVDTENAIEPMEESIQEPSKNDDNSAEATETVVNKPFETPRSAKRKAEDISQLTPGEERMGSYTRLLRRRAISRRAKNRTLGKLRQEASAAVEPPPHKRLRRVAEVVGYAALGGVAVMSALIATAPTL
ncbi:hypothetical protein FSARC_6 [Fusarium sarcochroum]|uniref:FHA domain-containing protein n=1 Tax=Fusarium sarcochroum TaxID=1208366 RepID=A0A8H4UCC5_9HYPO|nr:hypothetical protein FSARC_6 [Fusarium sarcochroum]